ncbi:phenylalanine N-monooxygenase-like isoform X1 [Telopea speciosissima]|uniref:phenylalanine N-monooxygenase-like isoform X1 n=2 Tax=Telopea speciosissima TaxID=54955 RepID=UPI001CC56CCF|nr:phenylalanine N-monooxygenase-like isoform X1 [Telopea speciosissima]
MKNNTSNFSSPFLTFQWGVTPDWATTTLGGTLISIFYPTTALLILVSLPFIAQVRSEIHKKSRPAPLPPGPASWPIVGNIPELFRKKPVFRWILGFMKEMNTEIACIRFSDVHVIPVTCPKIAREFLKKHDSSFASRPLTMGTEYSSRGFLSVAVAPWGDQWKKMRRVVASEVINPMRLRWLLEKRTEEADNLLYYIYNQCSSGGSVVDVRVAVRQYSGNVIRKMMFNKRYLGDGRKDGGPGVEEEEYMDALFTVLSLLYAFCVSDYMPSLRRFDLNGHEKIMKEAIRVVNKYHDPIMDERIQEWREGKKKENEDLLDILISMKDSNGKPLLSTEEIKAQAADLIYASVDNPSNAVEWSLAEMINKPEMLQKATEEIDRVVGKERLVQESDIPQLNYVKACAREAFRLHPIAPFNLPHVSNADMTVAGYFIPKGSHVILSRIGLGRNPKVWDDPHEFMPERHLKDPSIEVDLVEPELRFISFSTGRRGCMGIALGSAMTVMLLARLLQGFSWGITPGESRIELNESKTDLFLAKPLLAHAKPRLPVHAYSMP